jgi:hypothetical protein
MRGIRIATLLTFATLQAACATATLPDRYAHCEDLGTLRLASTSIDEAEDRMRAQVTIMGGDLLLFNARGHAEDTGDVPTALAQRRNVLARAPAVSINGRQPELAALRASAAAPEIAETLWYYGVALRCKQ